jgi:hypothetical protein
LQQRILPGAISYHQACIHSKQNIKHDYRKRLAAIGHLRGFHDGFGNATTPGSHSNFINSSLMKESDCHHDEAASPGCRELNVREPGLTETKRTQPCACASYDTAIVHCSLQLFLFIFRN